MKPSKGNKEILIKKYVTAQRRAENIPEAGEEYFRNIFEEGPLGIALTNLKTFKFEKVNNKLCRMLGYTEKELTKLRFPDITHPEDVTKDVVAAKKMFRGEIPSYKTEKRYIKKNKSILWVSLTASTIHDEEGKPIYALAMIEDITYPKKSEAVLKQSEENFRTLADSANDGILVVQGKNAKFVYANKQIAEITGYSAKEIFQMKTNDLVSPNELKKILSRYKKRINGKKEISNYETIIVGKERKGIPIEVTAAKTIWQNQPADLVIIRDITERKKAEEDIRQVARFPIENPNPVLRVSKDGTILYANKACSKILPETQCSTGKCVPLFLHNIIKRALRLNKSENKELENKGKIFLFEIVPIVKEGYANIYGLDITELKKTEERIKLFRKGFESLPNSMLLVEYKNGKPHINYVNNGFTAYYGYKEKEVLGKNPKFLKSGKQDKKYYKKMWKNILDPNIGFWRDEIVNKRKDGSFIDVILSISAIFDEKRELTHFVANHVDITERKKAEEKLKGLEEMYHDLYNNAPEPYQSFGPDGKFVQINNAWVKTFGYSKKEIIGKKKLSDLIPKSQLPQFKTHFAKLKRREKIKNFEYLIRKKDGTFLTIIINATGVYDNKGKFVMSRAILRDITEQKKTEEKLKESEERYRNLIETSTDAIIACDQNMKILIWNNAAEKMFGYKKEEAIGNSDTIIIPDRFVQRHKEGMKRVSDTGIPTMAGKSIELTAKRKNGEEFPVEYSLSVTKKEHGLIATTIIRDLTEKKKIEKEIRERTKELEKFNRMAVGRELKMIELKKKIIELEKEK